MYDAEGIVRILLTGHNVTAIEEEDDGKTLQENPPSSEEFGLRLVASTTLESDNQMASMKIQSVR